MSSDSTDNPYLEAVAEKAKSSMADVANRLATVIGPQAAGEIFMGCGITLITAALGDDETARYLRIAADGLDGTNPELAAEIGSSEIGHA